MTTVAGTIDRLFRTWLYPPDYQPPMASIASDVDSGATSFLLGPFTVLEDEELIRDRSLLEIGMELMRVTGYNSTSKVVTVERGAEGTPVSDHLTGEAVKLSPSYPRYSAYEFLSDNIVTLYPALYTVSADQLVTVSQNVAGIPDELAVEVVEVWPGNWMHADIDIDARIVDFHPNVGGRALITSMDTGSVWLRYRRRMRRPLSETENLSDLGVEEAWANILMAGVAADLFAGRDLPSSHVEWVGGVLQAENIPVGTRAQLSVGLVRYRELLIQRAQAEMRAEYKAKMRMNQPTRVVTRSPFG